MEKIKVIFFGTSDFVIPVLKILEENFNLVGVVTTPDTKIGRKQVLTPSSVKKYILKNHPEFYSKSILAPKNFDSLTIEQLTNLSPDLLIVASYGKIIPQNIIDISKYGALNIHPSLLPKYRGASPIQSAILNGDEVSGITVIKMDAEMDHGPIVFGEEYKLSEKDTSALLYTKMFQRSAEFLTSVIDDFVGGKTKLKPQDEASSTYSRQIKKEDAYFQIGNPPSAEKLDRMIRAYYPWPTAWSKWNGKVVKFLPGGLIQLEGKTPTPLKDFLNGHPDFNLKNLD